MDVPPGPLTTPRPLPGAAAPAGESAAGRRTSLTLLILVFVGFISLGLPDGLLGVAWPSIRQTFDLPLDALGVLFITTVGGYLAASLASGWVVQRIGVGILLALSALATSASLLTFALAPSWAPIVVAGVLAGLGGGAIDAGLNSYVAMAHSPRMLSWLHACFGVGAATGPAIMLGVLNAGQPWRLGYALVGAGQILLGLCFLLTRRQWQVGEARPVPHEALTPRPPLQPTMGPLYPHGPVRGRGGDEAPDLPLSHGRDVGAQRRPTTGPLPRGAQRRPTTGARGAANIGFADVLPRGEADESYAQRRGLGGEGFYQAEAEEHLSTLERLLATPRPARDPIALVSGLAGRPIPWVASGPPAGAQVPSPLAEAPGEPLQVGRQDTFYVLDQGDNTYKPRVARLRLVSQHAYWYVQEGQRVNDDDLATSANAFDTQTVPTVHRVFGTEWSPGIDGDARVTIFLGDVPGVGAYFSSWDEYPRSVYRYSNEREMIHVNLGSTRPGSSSFNGTLAHEFQHMVHWHMNPLDDTWLDEGFAELASSLVTPDRSPGTGSFQRQPDVQLTTWTQGGGRHYQASYLFSRYFAQRFGEAAVGQLLREKARPPESFTAYLSRAGQGVTFDDVFEDWIVANLLDDPSVGDGRYAHDGIEHQATIGLTLSPDGRPAEQTVQQYGAEYIALQGDGSDAELEFSGAPSVRLVGADAASGRGLWWSNRADGLESTLTRTFDLSGVTSATLQFNLWHDTERDFDFFYVLASADGGTRWQVLHGANATDTNPTGNAVGPGYSGRSGVSDGQRADPTWIAETVDLTPFAGGEIMIRFAYVTDQGYNAQGVLVDDVAIPEIGVHDDAETDGDWAAEGFLRSNNEIPQSWSLQLVEYQRGGQTTVRTLRADSSGQVVERLPSLGDRVERAVLVVSGLAPRTIEPAPFEVTLRPAP